MEAQQTEGGGQHGLISQMTPRELPPSSEPDYSFLIRTASQLSHISFPLFRHVRQEFSPRFNIYPALL